MAETVVLDIQLREGRGKRAAAKLRKQGLLPAVLYGHGEETLSISLAMKELDSAIRRHMRILDLKTGGKVEKVLIREVQWDHLGKELLHADFARVAADERITVSVPIELRGTAPGVSQGGGVIDQPIHTISIECLVSSIPDSIRVNVGSLQMDEAIHVKDLVLPEGVKALADPEAIIVHVTQKKIEEEPAPAAAAAAGEQAEPEVITRAKPEEEEEEAEKKPEKK